MSQADNRDDDRLRLHDMLEAAREVIAFTQDADRSTLETNRMLLRAVSMSIGIIGEAAAQVSDGFKQSHQDIPWREITGMRNFLFHVYFRLDNDIIWQTATHNVPALITQLEAVLADDSGGA